MKNRNHKRNKKPLLTPREKTLKWIFDAVSLFLILGAIVGCLELQEMDNNIQGAELFVTGAFAGSVISGCIIWYLLSTFKIKAIIKSVYGLCGALFIGFFLGGPTMLNYFNRSSPAGEHCSSHQVLEMSYSHRGRARSYHHVYIVLNGAKERVSVSHEVYHKIEGRDHISVCIVKGRLSFDFISRVDLSSGD